MVKNVKKRLSATVFLVVVLVVCAASAGCSSSSSSSSSSMMPESSSAAAESQASESVLSQPTSQEYSEPESASAEAPDEKPSKDGFDESSNTIVNIAGVNFQIPSYFGDRNEKDTYYAETGKAVAMLQIAEYNGVIASGEEFEKNRQALADSFVEGVGKTADEIGKPTVEDANVAGRPAATCIFEFKTSGVNAMAKVVYFYNDESKAVGILNLCQSEGTQYDYSADFDKIIASAVKGEAKSTAPTLGSTIEFSGLSIEFGTEIQTTTIENQFSDHNGETILRIPVKITNNGSDSGGLNMYAVKAFGSKGTELDTVFTYFDDDARMAGDMRPGASQEANLYIPYDGDGTYYLDFGFYKSEVEVEIPVKL